MNIFKTILLLMILPILVFSGCNVKNDETDDVMYVTGIDAAIDGPESTAVQVCCIDLGDDNTVTWSQDEDGVISIMIISDSDERAEEIKSMTYAELMDKHNNGIMPEELSAVFEAVDLDTKTISDSDDLEQGPDGWGIVPRAEQLRLVSLGWTPITAYMVQPNTIYYLYMTYNNRFYDKDLAFKVVPEGNGAAYFRVYYVRDDGNTGGTQTYIVPKGKVGDFFYGNPIWQDTINHYRFIACSEDANNGIWNSNIYVGISIFNKDSIY